MPRSCRAAGRDAHCHRAFTTPRHMGHPMATLDTHHAFLLTIDVPDVYLPEKQTRLAFLEREVAFGE